MQEWLACNMEERRAPGPGDDQGERWREIIHMLQLTSAQQVSWSKACLSRA